jgi:hypothetical protein
MGLGFEDFYDLKAVAGENDADQIIVYWNSSESQANRVTDRFINQLQWEVLFGEDADFQYVAVNLLQRLMNVIFGSLAPMLFSVGVISIVPLLIVQPLADREIRFMLCYWFVAFVVDFAIWIVAMTLIWSYSFVF